MSMTAVVLTLTVRQLLRQRRTLLLWILAALPVALALLFRITGGSPEENPNFAVGVLAHFIMIMVLPLTALVVGTAALGQDLEDGTIVYLIAKPIPRWTVVLAKILAAWFVTTLVSWISIVAAGAIILAGHEDIEMIPAFMAAALVASLTYSALFVMLSIRTGRALIIGLAYVFVWEALLSQFIEGVRFLSVRAYSLSTAQALIDTSSNLLNSPLNALNALILSAVVTALPVAYAIRRLNRFEMSERV